MLNLFVVIIACLLIVSCSSSSDTDQTSELQNVSELMIYVDSSADCDGNIPCFSTIQEAVSYSFESQFDVTVDPPEARRPMGGPDTIRVMPGSYVANWVYLGDFHVGRNYPQLFSTFYEGRWKLIIESTEGPDNTTFYSDANGPCFETTNKIDVTVRGFTFTQCSDSNYGHLVNRYSAIRVFSAMDASVTISNNIFHDNYSDGQAIGASPMFANIQDVEVFIVNNVLYNNSSGILVSGFSESATGNNHYVVANNIVYNHADELAFWNNNGYGIVSRYATSGTNVMIDIFNNTVVGNVRGFSIEYVEIVNMFNNIAFGNSEADMYLDVSLNVPGDMSDNIITHNLFGNGNNVGLELLTSDNINIIGDPLFSNMDGLDFSLSETSPAIDGGIVTELLYSESDIYGNSRINDGDGNGVSTPDIGAIEFTP